LGFFIFLHIKTCILRPMSKTMKKHQKLNHCPHLPPYYNSSILLLNQIPN